MIDRVVQRIATAIRPLAIACLVLAALVGLVVALPGVHWVIYFGGGGHGTIVPAYFLFAPSMLAWYEWACTDPPSPNAEFTFMSYLVCLYALYAAALTWGRRRAMGKWTVLGVLFFHYASLSVLAALQPGLSSFREFTKLIGYGSFLQSFGLIEYYFLLHVAAVAFAVSRWPVTREGIKRTCIWVATVTLISLVYVSWAIATTTH